jgi:hypothetical protein
LLLIPRVDARLLHSAVVPDVGPAPALGAIHMKVELNLAGWQLGMIGGSQNLLNSVCDLALLSY